MTSYLEQHMEYLTSELGHISNLVDDKFENIKGPDIIEYLKQEKYFYS